MVGWTRKVAIILNNTRFNNLIVQTTHTKMSLVKQKNKKISLGTKLMITETRQLLNIIGYYTNN